MQQRSARIPARFSASWTLQSFFLNTKKRVTCHQTPLNTATMKRPPFILYYNYEFLLELLSHVGLRTNSLFLFVALEPIFRLFRLTCYPDLLAAKRMKHPALETPLLERCSNLSDSTTVTLSRFSPFSDSSHLPRHQHLLNTETSKVAAQLIPT